VEYRNFGMMYLYWEHRHPACALNEQARCLFSQCLMPITTDPIFQFSTSPLFLSFF
jgi:hypothetical protein